MSNITQTPFPIWELPPAIGNAVDEIQRNTQAPLPLIVSSVLGAISLACQSKIDVRRLDGLVSPCSLYMLTIAESGDRKSTCDKAALKGIRYFEEAQSIALEPSFEKYRIDKSAYDEERRGVLDAIRSCARKGATTEKLKKQLVDIESRMPMEPKTPKLIFTDATPESLAFGLYKKWPSAGIMSDEGAVIFDSRTMNNLGMLNKLWDGDTLHVDRVSSESFVVKGARLTISLMVQPKTFDKFLQKQGGLSRDNGFLARFLVSRPDSTQGTRFITTELSSTVCLTAFQNRLTEILQSTMYSTNLNETGRITLKFSHDAQVRWIQAHNAVEGTLQAGGCYSDVKDAAAKILDNVARVAALFHYFQGEIGEIPLDTMNRAVAVCNWYLIEFKRIFSAESELPIDVSDANELGKWIFNYCRRYPGTIRIKKNVISQLGPNVLRTNKVRREVALSALNARDAIRFSTIGRAKYLELNPQLFPTFFSIQPGV